MSPVEIHPLAQQELEAALEHYLSIDAELASSFYDHYQRHLRLIAGNPLLYNLRGRMVRRANLIPRFGEHYLAYMIWDGRVVILAVAHAKRRPAYWSQRVIESKENP